LVRIRPAQFIATIADGDVLTWSGIVVAGGAREARDQRDTDRQTRCRRHAEAGQHRIGGAVEHLVAIGKQQHVLADRCAFGEHELPGKVTRQRIGDRVVIDHHIRRGDGDRRCGGTELQHAVLYAGSTAGSADDDQQAGRQTEALRGDGGPAGDRDRVLDMHVVTGAQGDISVGGR